MSGWSPQAGARVGAYRLLAPLGEGGMATLFVALQEEVSIRRLVAVKFVRPHLADSQDIRAMFADEVTISSQLSSPHVVRVIDTGTHEGVPFLVMEYLRGQSLWALLKACQGARPAPAIWLYVLAQVARGLYAAHIAADVTGAPLGIVHRDINPRNIHVGDGGHVTLLDFGVASAHVREARTRTGELKGTIAYLAPEQLQGGLPLDHRVDLWALGVVAHECLAGERLFRGESEGRTLWNIMNLEPPPLPEMGGYGDAVRDIVSACLRRDPAERPSNAEQVAVAFEQAALAAGESQETLKALMARHFADARASQEAQVQAAVKAAEAARAVAPLPAAAVEPSTEASEATELPRRGMGRWLGLGVAAAACLVAAGWWTSTHVGSPAPETLGPSSPNASPEATAPATPVSRMDPAMGMPSRKVDEGAMAPIAPPPPQGGRVSAPEDGSSATDDATAAGMSVGDSSMRRPRRRPRGMAAAPSMSRARYIEEAPY